MTLLAPLGLAAAALVAPLVVLYLLRSRRPRRVVASTLLFLDEQETRSAAVPWQPFTPDRTFWLVGAALLVGALALGRPAVAVPAEVGDHTILVIDASASMQAVAADGRSRMEHARDRAEELIDLAGDGRLVSIVQAGTHARVLADTVPTSQARAVLPRLQAGGTAGAADDALTLAAALIRPGEQTVMHLLTDGGVSADAAALAPAGTVLTLVGDPAPNLAIGAIRATPLGGGSARVLVQLNSYADLPVDARVVITVDDERTATRTASLLPRGQADVEVEVAGLDGGSGGGSDGGLDGGAQVVEATVMIDSTGPTGAAIVDALPYDSRARVVLPRVAARRVLHVGPPNVFLDAALESLPDVVVIRRPSLPDPIAGVDVVVLDRTALPDGLGVPALVIAPTSVPEGVAVTGHRELPAITAVQSTHPLLADVDLRDLAVAEMAVIDAPSLHAVVDGPAGPLLLSGRVGDAAVVLLPFALADSNLPLQVAFPVLLANVVQLLTGPASDTPLVAGADRVLPLPPGVTATLTGPDGSAVAVGGERPSATLDVPGLWQVRYDGPAPPGAPTVLAVNPDTGESDLAVRAPDLGGSPVPDDEEDPGGTASRLALAGATPLTTDGRIELWRWFAAAALLLLMAELAASLAEGRRRRWPA